MRVTVTWETNAVPTNSFPKRSVERRRIRHHKIVLRTDRELGKEQGVEEEGGGVIRC